MMWRAYSVSYLKRNKAASVSILVAALLAALFLSLLCSAFYNAWVYEIQRITLTEGDWHARIVVASAEADMAALSGDGALERAAVNQALSGDGETVVDLRFRDVKTVYADMPRILEKLDLPADAASYHATLLSRYLVHDPADPEPPLLLSFYIAVLITACAALILILHNAFAVSMDARVRQLGILSSIGATPGQIRGCLLREAAALCAAPVLLGSVLGTGLCYGLVQGANRIAAQAPGRHEAVFQGSLPVFLMGIAAAGCTVLLSAWIPARRLSRLTPLAAIRSAGMPQLKKKRKSKVLSLLFGVEGELAGNALKAQARALRTARLSFTLSFSAFAVMLCFLTLSDISTNHTYFERYQDAWDVMITVPDTDLSALTQLQKIRELAGVADCVGYQRTETLCRVPEEAVSRAVDELGGMEAVSGGAAAADGDGWLVKAAVMVLDDEGFCTYCRQAGIPAETDGAIVINQVWDQANSHFRDRIYVPYVKETGEALSLQGESGTAALPVLGYAQSEPVLREDYPDGALTLILPLSLWETVGEAIGGERANSAYVRLLAPAGATLAQLEALERDAAALLGETFQAESENRLTEKAVNDEMIAGYRLLVGGLCALLALIGAANVFSNTLGFLRQRKREFARCASVGMTPGQMGKQFCIEALTLAGRPVITGLAVTALTVSWMINASHLEPGEFLRQAPVVPVLLFILAIFGLVGLAYCLGGRRICNSNLLEALRDETLL